MDLQESQKEPKLQTVITKEPGGMRKRLPILITVAAVLVIGLAVILSVTAFGSGSTERIVEQKVKEEAERKAKLGAEPIEWVVLEKQADRMLVISLYALDCQPYNTDLKEVTWETCTLRSWLNDSFYNTAFDGTEKARILQTIIENPDSYGYFQTDYAKNLYFGNNTSRWGANGGNATADNVFLLSWEEVSNYFSSNNARRCALTVYAVAGGHIRIQVPAGAGGGCGRPVTV